MQPARDPQPTRVDVTVVAHGRIRGSQAVEQQERGPSWVLRWCN
ncbi:MAG TPA: hypothetical protein VK935_08535 [Actinomycetospora sp.]|nr:hypothetical protein [Actinomycetospora sp.]